MTAVYIWYVRIFCLIPFVHGLHRTFSFTRRPTSRPYDGAALTTYRNSYFRSNA